MTTRADRFDHLFVQPGAFDASLAFYRDVLGWEVEFAWGDAGQPRGASLGSGGMRIIIAEDHPARDHSKSHGINGTRPTVHLAVEDLDARYAQIAPSGMALFAPEATHWGTRWFVVREPSDSVNRP